MNKEMIISSGDHETRVAILEDDQVVEVFIEREKQRGVVGNVYKGRVNKVLPGMQSSFIDIGLERDAFLYVSEVVNTVEEFERLAGDDEDEPAVALGTPPPRRRWRARRPRPALRPSRRSNSLRSLLMPPLTRARRPRRRRGGARGWREARTPRTRRRGAGRAIAIARKPRSKISSRKARTSSSRS